MLLVSVTMLHHLFEFFTVSPVKVVPACGAAEDKDPLVVAFDHAGDHVGTLSWVHGDGVPAFRVAAGDHDGFLLELFPDPDEFVQDGAFYVVYRQPLGFPFSVVFPPDDDVGSAVFFLYGEAFFLFLACFHVARVIRC